MRVQHVRVARPTDDLEAVLRFYRDGGIEHWTAASQRRALGVAAKYREKSDQDMRGMGLAGEALGEASAHLAYSVVEGGQGKLLLYMAQLSGCQAYNRPPADHGPLRPSQPNGAPPHRRDSDSITGRVGGTWQTAAPFL